MARTLHSLLFCFLLFISLAGSMAEARKVAPGDDLLEWVQKDNRRFLHAVFRVGDLDRAIKFYNESFGMKVLRKRDSPEEKFSSAVLGFGPEESHFAVELKYYYGADKIEIGTGFGHFGIATTDIYKMTEDVRANGGVVTREPGPIAEGGTTIFGFVQDPDGYSWELIQRDSTPEPLCQIMLRVVDLDLSIKFYEKALGMKLLLTYDNPRENYTMAMVGYGPINETTVLELISDYNVTEYTKGNGYVQVAIGTDNVYKSAAAVKLVSKELGGELILPPGPIPVINTRITSFVDPDGWNTVLVDNEDFLKNLQKKD